jgi:type 2 lantibiotic biosynthesis protein LanM
MKERIHLERPWEDCPLPLPDALRMEGLAPCLGVVAPMIHVARERVCRGARRLAEEYPRAPFEPVKVEESLAVNLAAPLLAMLNRVLVLELNVARLEGLLDGGTPRDRFLSFAHHLCGTGSKPFLQEYSALRDQIAGRLDRWAEFSLEFLQHLCEDWASIGDSLLGKDSGPVVQIETGAGDTHRNGRSVVIVSFASGARIVYKPRSISVDEHFQQLLAWLNARGAQPEFHLLRCISRGNHGWTEFLVPGSCRNVDEISRFYRRQGSYLALLYALEASDFHCENLIAAGEHPMLIDVEALFHPRLDKPAPEGAHEVAGAALGYSALRVGLLPVRYWAEEGGGGVDLSGLGSAAGQLTPGTVPQWEEAGTDNMRIVRKRVPIGRAENRPTIDGDDADPLDHAEQIAAGFDSTYRLLLKHRSELREVLTRFSNDEVRVIARATQTYGTILRESFHPDLLHNDDDRLALFGRLREAAEYRPCLLPLVAAECDDLMRGDIPLFTTRPASRHLWTSSGERLENYLENSGADLVENRLQQLSESDLERQLWIVRASLATLSSRTEGPPVNFKSRLELPQDEVSASALIAAACAIGDRLSQLAFVSGEDVSWLGLIPTGEHEWHVSPLGLDLYDGLPGVALFLAQLGSISGQRRYTELARAALDTAMRPLKKSHGLETIGAFTGWGGIIYTLSSLGVIWAEPSLIEEAEALLDLLPDLIARDESLDVIGGAAGCALAVRSLYECRRSDRIFGLACHCGERLLSSARQMNRGFGWACDNRASAPLAGFAHGSAGIGHALFAIGELTGDKRYRDAGVQAFAYERSLFSEEHQNWPDLRGDGRGFVTAWCHGAPGIGLSRLCAFRHLRHEESRREIYAALATTAAQAFTGNHTLCHGDLGNADVLLTASDILRQDTWRTHANWIAAAALATARSTGWICGNPLGVESPGLMTGIAGIGYTLLRLAHPGRVPSILALQPAVRP